MTEGRPGPAPTEAAPTVGRTRPVAVGFCGQRRSVTAVTTGVTTGVTECPRDERV
jgi:hypothetical protein